jgi:hypothetical protein
MTDYEQQLQLARERALRYGQQAQYQAPQGRMVGNIYVAPNPLEYLAAGLRSLGGMRGQQMAQEEITQIGSEREKALANALRGFTEKALGRPAEVLPPDVAGPPRPAEPQDMPGAYRALMGAPDAGYRQMAMQGQLNVAQQQAEQQRKAQENQRLMSILQSSTPQQAIAAGVPVDLVKSYYEAPNIGRAEVARTVEITGANGEKLIQQLDKAGQPVGAPMPAYNAPMQINTGGAIELVAPKAGQRFAVGMSPSERDASARGWANVRLGQERLEIDKPKTTTPGKQLTESQAKGALFLGQMRSATNELDKLAQIVSPVQTAMTGSTYTNWAAPENAQQVAQLQNQWSEAYLRAKTGAAATLGEVELNRRTFFPVVGDGPLVISQKQKMREQAERDMEPTAGPAAQTAGQSPTRPTPPNELFNAADAILNRGKK